MNITFNVFIKGKNHPAVGVKFSATSDSRPMIGDKIVELEHDTND